MSVILLGSFNPSIFQPAWFGAHEVVRQEEADAAEIEVIHPDASSFKADWLALQVTKSRFVASASDAAHQGALKDLVLAVFAILEHTPIDKMGLNRDMHFGGESREGWHSLGDILVPKQRWEKIMREPGLRSLIVEDGRDVPQNPKLTVRIEPSPSISPGVFVGVNNHYEETGADSARKLLATLAHSWDDVQRIARETAERLLNQQD